jgi:restriction system protein
MQGMRYIIIGNKRYNVFSVLRTKLGMGVYFLLCWYIYSMMGQRLGFHLEAVFIIGTTALLLMNLLCMPIRLLGSRKIGYEVKFLFVVVADLAALYCGNAILSSRQLSVANVIGKLLMMIIFSLAVTWILVALKRKLKVHAQKNKYRGCSMDDMEGHAFEFFCAELLKANGFRSVEVTQGSGDFGIDIIAVDLNGLKYGIQCKRYESNVGWHAVEEARAGAEYYGCDRAVVMTNNYFTRQAIEGAQKINVELWNRDVLTGWM